MAPRSRDRHDVSDQYGGVGEDRESPYRLQQDETVSIHGSIPIVSLPLQRDPARGKVLGAIWLNSPRLGPRAAERALETGLANCGTNAGGMHDAREGSCGSKCVRTTVL